MCGCSSQKQCFIDMVCYPKSHPIILWHVISMKLNTGKEITGLEIMTLNYKEI